jgi:isoleucyl-tRNA synthetase
LQDIAHADGDLVDISIKANFKSLGAKYGKAVQEVAQLIQAADAPALVRKLRTEPSETIGSFNIFGRFGSNRGSSKWLDGGKS